MRPGGDPHPAASSNTDPRLPPASLPARRDCSSPLFFEKQEPQNFVLLVRPERPSPPRPLPFSSILETLRMKIAPALPAFATGFILPSATPSEHFLKNHLICKEPLLPTPPPPAPAPTPPANTHTAPTYLQQLPTATPQVRFLPRDPRALVCTPTPHPIPVGEGRAQVEGGGGTLPLPPRPPLGIDLHSRGREIRLAAGSHRVPSQVSSPLRRAPPSSPPHLPLPPVPKSSPRTRSNSQPSDTSSPHPAPPTLPAPPVPHAPSLQGDRRPPPAGRRGAERPSGPAPPAAAEPTPPRPPARPTSRACPESC